MNKQNRSFISAAFILVVLGALPVLSGCRSSSFHPDAVLQYCVDKVAADTVVIKSYDSVPRNIENGKKGWKLVGNGDWTSGFFPGILWFTYQYTNNPVWKA